MKLKEKKVIPSENNFKIITSNHNIIIIHNKIANRLNNCQIIYPKEVKLEINPNMQGINLNKDKFIIRKIILTYFSVLNVNK